MRTFANDPDESIGALLRAEHARAERLLNHVRGGVLLLLGAAAIVYAPALTAALVRVNILVFTPMLLWTAFQELRYHRPHYAPSWLITVNAAADLGAITALQAGYGLAGIPGLALHSPIFLAYFAVLASRPFTGSERHAAGVTIGVVCAYATLVAAMVLTGRVHLVNSPLAVTTSSDASMLDEGAKLMLLGMVGAIATYATAWNERTLRRALAAQLRRDIEEREMTDRLREADKLAAIGTLAAATVHDVRNPLTAIALQSELLMESPLGEPLRNDLTLILEEARRAMAFLADLLQFARSANTEPETVPLAIAETVDAAVAAARPLLHEHRIPVEVSIENLNGNLAPLHGSPMRLERALVNLLVNSVQAMEEQDGAKAIRVHARPDATGRGVILDVDDTGPGFPAGLVTRAFERFVTTKPPGKGTGLGLWMVRQTVSDLGGRVSAINLAGGGARVRVELSGDGVA